ncbi:MAG: hypothetical protein IJ054_07690 [Lachnospiraceae bacterium]|nr:hypothetical protein [Lachnospiraceae bacterium]MBQ9608132.1 hypothetical protein [Lachnospiraceae bacterium]
MKKHTTLIIDESLLDKLKDYAYTERISQTEALKRALTEFLKDKDNGLPHWMEEQDTGIGSWMDR